MKWDLKVEGKSEQIREILTGTAKALENEAGDFILEATLERVDKET